MALAMEQKLAADRAGGPLAALLGGGANAPSIAGVGGALPPQTGASAPPPPPAPPVMLPPLRPMPARSIGPPPPPAAGVAQDADTLAGAGATGRTGDGGAQQADVPDVHIVMDDRSARKVKGSRRQRRQE